MLKITTETAISKKHLGYPKPIEDFILVDREDKIFIILDGVTRDISDGIYPNPSPAFEVSKIFAEEVFKYLKQENHGKDITNLLRLAVLKGNYKIKEYNDKATWNFLPGTVGIISIIVNNKFYYVFIGDCIGQIFHENKLRFFTYSQTKLINDHKNEFSADQIRNNICNNKNHPYGYGVFTGQEGVMEFLEFGKESLYEGDIILLATDGMDKLLDNKGFQMTPSISAKELIARGEELEKDECLKSDDKAVIVVRIGENVSKSKSD
jgi:serine/threonine protein phosphatase PrpC